MSESGEELLQERLVSLDAYRGFIMLAMASGGLGIAAVASQFPKDRAWQILGYQLEHVPWIGCSFWDLIQPSFMFMVGAAMAYSYDKREARGDSFARMLGHALLRSLILVLLGIFLSSEGEPQTHFTFVNVLTQIGLGYTPLFLVWWIRRPVWQLLAALVVLAGYWSAFYYYPPPTPDFDRSSVGLPADWQPLEGRAAHWDKNTNAAAAFDRRLLNLFPRKERFEFNSGGYQTLNFIPSLATMIFGLLAGELLRGYGRGWSKLLLLTAAGGVLLGSGWLLDYYDICPLVKRIWTPSWALYSAGWASLMLAGFYLVVDLVGLKRTVWPLVVVGMNSILMYVMAQLMGGPGGWIAGSLETHFGEGLFTAYGQIDPVYEPIGRMVLVLLAMWLVCAWLYRQRIFVRI